MPIVRTVRRVRTYRDEGSGTTQSSLALSIDRKIPFIPEKSSGPQDWHTERRNPKKRATSQTLCDKHSRSVSSTSAKEFGQFLLRLNRRARCLSRQIGLFARQPFEKISTQIPQQLKGMYLTNRTNSHVCACLCYRASAPGSYRMQPSNIRCLRAASERSRSSKSAGAPSQRTMGNYID